MANESKRFDCAPEARVSVLPGNSGFEDISPTAENRNWNKKVSKLAETDFSLATKTFEEMRLQGITLDSITYNAMVRGLSKAGRLKKACSLLAEMRALGHQPAAATYSKLLALCQKAEKIGLSLQLFEEMKQQGITPTRTAYSTIISTNAKCKSGGKNGAIKLFRY